MQIRRVIKLLNSSSDSYRFMAQLVPSSNDLEKHTSYTYIRILGTARMFFDIGCNL